MVQVMTVNPKDLRFTQRRISATFKAPHQETRIVHARDKVASGHWSAATFPAVTVIRYEGELWCVDNRRLWVFRKAGVTVITVNVCRSTTHPRLLALIRAPAVMKKMKSESFFPFVPGEPRTVDQTSTSATTDFLISITRLMVVATSDLALEFGWDAEELEPGLDVLQAEKKTKKKKKKKKKNMMPASSESSL